MEDKKEILAKANSYLKRTSLFCLIYLSLNPLGSCGFLPLYMTYVSLGLFLAEWLYSFSNCFAVYFLPFGFANSLDMFKAFAYSRTLT